MGKPSKKYKRVRFIPMEGKKLNSDLMDGVFKEDKMRDIVEQEVVLIGGDFCGYRDFFFTDNNQSLSWYIKCGYKLIFIKDDPKDERVCAVFER